MENLHKERNEDSRMLAEIERKIRKMYNDANKLKKQGALLTGDSSVFLCSLRFKKDYLCTYIRAYDGVVEEMQFEELNNMVNPKVYENGVFVVSSSKNQRVLRFDSESSSNNNSIGPLNSTLEDDSIDCSDDINLDESCVRVKDINIVNCGNCELFSKDINAGGEVSFHGILGQFRKASVILKDITPVSSVQGRYLLAVYIQFLKHLNIRDAPATFICCEPKRPIGVLNFLTFPEKSGDGKNRIHIVTVFDDANKKHAKKENIGQSSYLSIYDMFKTASDEKSDGETSLRIEFHWSGNDYNPMDAPPCSAKSVVQLQVTVGESRSAANEVFQELRRLDMITPANINISTQFLNSTNSDQVIDELRKFKNSVSDIQFYDHRESASTDIADNKTDDIETPMSQLLMEGFRHKDIDFTDKLWLFIQQSDHLEYIRFILDDVLTDIVNGSLQPAISPSNETKLAKYIRKLYVTSDEMKADAEEKITELIGSEQSIINLIREIGYEKLRKDYFNFFIKRELASLSNLEKICKPSSVDILALWKLHYCLEIVITPTMYLNLTPDCQCTLLKAAIDYYSVNKVDIMSPKFCLLLLPFHESAASLRDLCSSRLPVIWQHGSMHPNKAGLNEALITRVDETMIFCDDDEEDIAHTNGRNRLLREELLILPNIEM